MRAEVDSRMTALLESQTGMRQPWKNMEVPAAEMTGADWDVVQGQVPTSSQGATQGSQKRSVTSEPNMEVEINEATVEECRTKMAILQREIDRLKVKVEK